MPRRTRPRSRGTRRRRESLRSRVELLDLVGEVLVHDPPAKLQGRRELARLLREVARQDCEPLDLLDADAIAIDVVDELLHELLRIAARRRDLRLVERDE